MNLNQTHCFFALPSNLNLKMVLIETLSQSERAQSVGLGGGLVLLSPLAEVRLIALLQKAALSSEPSSLLFFHNHTK